MKIKDTFTQIARCIFYILIGLNIGNLWLITDNYKILDLTHEQKDVYFGFIFTQIFTLFFLAQKDRFIIGNIFVFFNIIFGLIVLFH